MSQLPKKVTLNLRDAYRAPKLRRARRALNIIKEKAKRIAKVERVKISDEISRLFHSRSVERPPKKVTLLIERNEEDEVVVRLGGETTAEQSSNQ
ncbi:MAG: hypothetical protein RMJ28_01280 [Nitrososphaerota archaeon]|nr:hypothetical protein [Candidatus Calditenuaceae archaeon]MDW8072859.1 hypothetical protein [Nitrososphaerota archaeon]